MKLWARAAGQTVDVSGGMAAAVLAKGAQAQAIGEDTYNYEKGASPVMAVALGDGWMACLHEDGTVRVTGDNGGDIDAVRWTDVKALSAASYLLALRTDGTAMTAGQSTPEEPAPDVSEWTDVVAIAADSAYALGLKVDGTVVTAGEGAPDVSGWADIIAIDVGLDYALALTADGAALSVSVTPGLEAPDVSGWTDIVAIAAGDDFALGLKSDGTVVTAGEPAPDVSGWTDIAAVAAGDFALGVKTDGTAVAAGENAPDVSGWNGIVLD